MSRTIDETIGRAYGMKVPVRLDSRATTGPKPKDIPHLHWCSDETNALLMSLPFVGAAWYAFRRRLRWLGKRFRRWRIRSLNRKIVKTYAGFSAAPSKKQLATIRRLQEKVADLMREETDAAMAPLEEKHRATVAEARRLLAKRTK